MTHYDEQIIQASIDIRKSNRPMVGFLTEEQLLESITEERAHADLITDNKEVDPNGIDAHTPGAKLDSGKVRPGLVLGDFSNALLAVSEVGTYGANKYTDHGWLEVKDGVNRYKDAMQRHLLKHNTGELLDNETGLTHLAAVAWNVLAILELTIKEGK